MLNLCVFRRPGMNGEGGEEAYDGQGPLHLAAQWGQVILTFNLKLLYIYYEIFWRKNQIVTLKYMMKYKNNIFYF